MWFLPRGGYYAVIGTLFQRGCQVSTYFFEFCIYVNIALVVRIPIKIHSCSPPDRTCKGCVSMPTAPSGKTQRKTEMMIESRVGLYGVHVLSISSAQAFGKRFGAMFPRNCFFSGLSKCSNITMTYGLHYT